MATRNHFDAAKGFFTFACGRKGSGKSVLTRRIWDSYPGDKMVIDITQSVAHDLRREGRSFTLMSGDMVPLRFPAPLADETTGERSRSIVVYQPDMGAKDAVDQMDRALGIALARGRVAVWIDEIGDMARVGATPPNLRRALHHGRHRRLTLLMAGPRPIAVDPLCIAQADHVFTFDLPNPADRKRVADVIGWPPAPFEKAAQSLRSHEYLWYNALAEGGAGELLHMPPLPAQKKVLPQRGDTAADVPE